MRRALLVTSDFPPVAGTNVQRVLKFAKYLPQFDWMPIVLTQRAGVGSADPSHLEDLAPGVRIVRSGSLDPFVWLGRRMQSPESIAGGGGAAAAAGPGPAEGSTGRFVRPGPLSPDVRSPGAPSLRRALLGPPSRALQALLRHFFYIPDPLMMWVPRAFMDGLTVIRRERPAVLLSSCPSFSSHVLGLFLARTTGLPWIADFRDLWVGRPYRSVPSRLHAAGNRSLERWVVSRCDRLVICAPAWREVFRRRYGESVAAKIRYVPNGYDPEDIPPPPPPSPDGLLRFVYTGGIYSAASPAQLLRALGLLVREDPGVFRRIRIILAGPSEEQERALLTDLARDLQVQEALEFRGVITHCESLRLQAAADVLVLSLAPGHRDTISGKGFEYMASGRPILGLLPLHGDQAEILRRSGLGICVEHGDVEGTVEAVRRLVSHLLRGAPPVTPDSEYIRTFDRRLLTGRLAGVLDEAATARRGR